jgi:hypothetical protein
MSSLRTWRNIKEDADYKGAGVYWIRLTDLKGSPFCISRFLDKDEDGILQIGSSKDIVKRIKLFRGAAKGKKYPHSAGRRLSLIKESNPFKKKYKEFKILYTFKKLNNERTAKKEEKKLLKHYFKKFGEVPPLNNNLPSKDFK